MSKSPHTRAIAKRSHVLMALLAGLAAVLLPSASLSQSRNGTTLAASKTLDICLQPNGSWRYSGVLSVWNEGKVPTVGFAVTDCIQNKPSGFQYVDQYCTNTFYPDLIEIPAGTTQPTALTFAYFFHEAPLPPDIRNIARTSILNHSGSMGTAKGPEPKASWFGEVLACDRTAGCVDPTPVWTNAATQWPVNYDRGAPFFNSGKTWQQILGLGPTANGYYILAQQYIGTVLNIAGNGSAVPAGLQVTLTSSNNFFAVNSTAEVTCPNLLSCGLQRTWAGTLEKYNISTYPAGPEACVH